MNQPLRQGGYGRPATRIEHSGGRHQALLASNDLTAAYTVTVTEGYSTLEPTFDTRTEAEDYCDSLFAHACTIHNRQGDRVAHKTSHGRWHYGYHYTGATPKVAALWGKSIYIEGGIYAGTILRASDGDARREMWSIYGNGNRRSH